MMMKNGILSVFFLLILGSYAYAKPAMHDPRRASSAPYISGDTFRAVADHVYDETDRSLKGKEIGKKNVIFVKTDYLDVFFSTIHPHIRFPYILITHNSDFGAPGAYARYLDDPKLYRWFGQNPTIMNHPKFIPIPIGIANKMWPHGNTAVFDKAIARPVVNRDITLGINFTVGTKPDVRQMVYNLFIDKPYCFNIGSKDLFTYLTNMKKTTFILSPVGNGLDCHRTWEAFLMGAIPVMEHTNLDELLADLPVLIVDSWAEVTYEKLVHAQQAFEEQKNLFNVKKITFGYWRDLIEAARSQL